MREAGGEVVPLHGTPAPALPPHVVDAVARALGTAAPAPHPRGLPELRERLAGDRRRDGPRRRRREHELVVTNGAMHALGLCFRSLLEPGDEVVVPAPCFFFEGPIRAAGGVPVYVRGSADEGWAWDADAIEHAVGPRTRALLLCNPGNPTGAVPSRGRGRLGRLAWPSGAASCSSPTRRTRPRSGMPSSRPPSRSPGARSSSGASARASRCRTSGSASSPGRASSSTASRLALEWDVLRVGLAPQVAATAVLDGPRAWLDDVHAGLAADRTVASAEAERAGLRFVPPRGGPFLFVSDDRPDLADSLVAAGIPAVDGRHFQSPGWARVPFGGAASCRAALAEALARWATAR